jgi:putative ABC transport system permease protein
VTINWRQIVLRRARETGAEDLPVHAVDELAEHLEDLYSSARQAGLSDDDARRRALAALDESRLGSIVGSRRRTRLSLRSFSMSHAFRLALRQFRHHPTFALVTMLVLGLGVGAGVTVYTIVDSVLLRPLPYREPDRLVMLWDTNHEKGLRHEPISPVNFMDYRALDVFESGAAWWRPDVNLVEPGEDPVRVRAIETGANLFEVLGVRPQIGPGFPANGPMFHADLIAVVSDRLWRSRYHADPGLIGRQIQLNGAPYMVVGVMPARFDFPGEIDVWQRSRWDFRQHSRAAHFMEAVMRIRSDADLPRAEAAATGLAARLESGFPNSNRAWGVRLVSLLDDQLGYYRPALIVLSSAVALLMTIGCLNIASLLLTRALSREREIAVRTALGATPRHLSVQLLAEALILSLAGAAVGVLATFVALPMVQAAVPVTIPRLQEATVNVRALGFALAFAVGATLVFGLVPALVLLRRRVSTGLRTGERGVSRSSRLIYRLLVVGEVAMACALLVSSGLLIRTVDRMMQVPTGVDAAKTLIASVQLSSGPGNAIYNDWNAVASTYGSILERLRQERAVKAAGASNFLPLDPGWRMPFSIEGEPLARPDERPQAQFHTVSDGYFEAMGVGLASGRGFVPQDTAQTTAVIIVNETFARRFASSRAVIGQQLMTDLRGIGPLGRNLMAPPQPAAPAPPAPAFSRFEIVGVIRDVKDVPLSQPTEPAVYFTARQFPFRAMYLAIAAADTASAMTALQASLRDAAPGVPFTDVRTWEERVRAKTAEPRLLMMMLVFFGALAAVLAVLGVYGLFSWSVALRRRELAIRLTLGAKPAGVAALVVRQGALLVAAGLGGGWLIVAAANQAISRVLFGVTSADPASVGIASGVLLLASLVACVPPAIRAMRVQPVEGLRIE